MPRNAWRWLLLAALCAPIAAYAAGDAPGSDIPHLNVWPDGVPSPDFSLTTTSGAPRTMRNYQGFVTLVEFGYANCPGPCSLELQKAATAVRSLGAQAAGVRVVFITLDPERDSKPVLDHFVHSFNPAFVPLRGTVTQINAATQQFSIENARLPGTDGQYLIDHTIEEFLFDRAGRLRLVGGVETTAPDIARGLSQLLLTAQSKTVPTQK